MKQENDFRSQFNPNLKHHIKLLERAFDTEFTKGEKLRFLTENYYEVTDIIYDNRLSLIYHIKLVLQNEDNHFCFPKFYNHVYDIIEQNTYFSVYPLKGILI